MELRVSHRPGSGLLRLDTRGTLLDLIHGAAPPVLQLLVPEVVCEAGLVRRERLVVKPGIIHSNAVWSNLRGAGRKPGASSYTRKRISFCLWSVPLYRDIHAIYTCYCHRTSPLETRLVVTRPCRAVLLGEELHAALARVPLDPRRLQRDARFGVLDRRREGVELGVARRAVAVRRVAGPGHGAAYYCA